jgi:hypothetical protein
MTTITLPSTAQEKVLVSTDKTTYFKGEGVILKANYYFLTTPLGGDCRFSISPTVFNTTDQLGQMYYSSGLSAYVNFFPLSVRTDAPSGGATIWVTCNTSNHYTVTNSTSITVLSGNTRLSFRYELDGGQVGEVEAVGVSYNYADGSAVTNATCDLYINGYFQAPLDESPIGSGKYIQYWTYASPVGTQRYNVTCTFGSESATVSGIYTVSKASPTTTTLKPVKPPNHCTDSQWNYDETATDCGGSCEPCGNGKTCIEQSDCTNYCNPNGQLIEHPSGSGSFVQYGVCGTPRCPDGFKWSGYVNWNIDCGAPTCPPCECGDSQLLDGCAKDGSEWCDSTAGKCTSSPCLNDFQCPKLALRINDSLTWVSRLCDMNVNLCKFRGNMPFANASTSMIIYPLSGVTYDDGSGGTFLIGNCEENTNGFRITTPVSTHTQYIIRVSPYIPSIFPTFKWQYFGTSSSDKSSTIPELCNFVGDYKYARIEFHSEVSGGFVSNETIDAIIFKTKFNVSVLPSTAYDNGAVFSLSRYGTCYVRPDRITPYSFAGNGTSMDIDYYVLTNTTSVEWLCNSTYNEQKTGTFGHTGSWLFIWGLGLLWGFFFGWIEWKPWYLLIIVFVLMIILPLLYLIWRDRRD